MKKLPSFSFTKHFKLFAVISILLVSLGLVSLILLPFKIYLFNLDIDFLGGVAYANGGSIKPVANNTFIITPYNVGFQGDELSAELESNGVLL